ncbi:MAG: hypothetical protein QXR96_00010 [Candidatus Woesearchaeota archaeon]
MKLPTREQCFEYYKKFETPENILEHVKKVNEIANFIAKKLNEKLKEQQNKKNNIINLELVDRVSLIHDLDKWFTLKNKEFLHGHITKEFLEKEGYPELGFYAKQHIIEDAELPFKTWEEKIVAYADKRANGSKIVTLKDRFDYINKRYVAIDIEKRKFAEKLSYEIEKEIFDVINIKPEDLEKEIEIEKNKTE